MNRTLIFFTALLLLFCGGTFFWYATSRTQAARTGESVAEVDSDFVAPEKELTEFEFTDQLANTFNSKELEGKVWMASFFFASCPSICRQQNAEIAKVHRRFKDEDVTILNITVTPDQDSPHVLLLYANQFEADHEKWKFLTGQSLDYVKQVGAEFFSLPAADETHTTDVALFGSDGEMYGPYKVTDPREQTKLILKTEELLAASGSPVSQSETPKSAEPEDSSTESGQEASASSQES